MRRGPDISSALRFVPRGGDDGGGASSSILLDGFVSRQSTSSICRLSTRKARENHVSIELLNLMHVLLGRLVSAVWGAKSR